MLPLNPGRRIKSGMARPGGATNTDERAVRFPVASSLLGDPLGLLVAAAGSRESRREARPYLNTPVAIDLRDDPQRRVRNVFRPICFVPTEHDECVDLLSIALSKRHGVQSAMMPVLFERRWVSGPFVSGWNDHRTRASDSNMGEIHDAKLTLHVAAVKQRKERLDNLACLIFTPFVPGLRS